MKTWLYPMVQFKKDTWEMDEFECASVFVLVGKEKAMVIDAGIGIGDLIGAIRMTITDKPLVIVATHGHGDHTGGMGNFDEYYLSEKDWFYPVEESIEMRRGYSAMIAKRQGGYYPWVADRDITPFEKQPRRLLLEAGVEFDLGGRIIKTIACPGHTPGQIAFLDESSRSLFCGDALNCNLGYGGMPGKPIDWEHVTSVERALEGLEALAAAKDSYDGIYNGHHDYRPLGAPLDESVLPDAMTLCKQLISGQYNVVLTKNPLGEGLRACVKKGLTEISFNPETILESQMKR